MKRGLIIFLILITVSCKKDLTTTDYAELIGKYKLVYSLRATNPTIDKIYFTDNYELDFNRNGKAYTYKNGHCESKEKVEDCHAVIYSPSLRKDIHLYLKKRDDAIQMSFQYYSIGYDTLIVSSYFPFEDHVNQNPYRYAHYYVRE
jgi:hypothetical protein